MSHFYTDVDHFALLPAIILALFGCAIFLFDSLLEARSRRWQLCLILPGLAITGWQLWKQGQVGTFTAFHGALTIDPFSLFFNWLFLLTAVLIALISYRYLEIEKEHQGEYYGLVLMAQSGAYFLATGTEWRTQPLWGLGLNAEVNGNTFFLHDGRARTLAEAILWHSGEALASRSAFEKLSKPERGALLAFLASL